MEIQENWTPVKDYAKVKGVSVQAIYEKIKKGKIQSKKIGTYTLVRT